MKALAAIHASTEKLAHFQTHVIQNYDIFTVKLYTGVKMRRIVMFPCFFIASVLLAGMALAAAPQPGKLIQDEPQPVANRLTSISVITEGTDSLGSRLSTKLKERFNQSSLFRLSGEDENDGPELRLLLTTQPEFPARPGLGSIYGVCWVFRQGKGYLGYLLAREIGTFTSEEVDGLVDKLVERTDGIAAKYSNLWK